MESFLEYLRCLTVLPLSRHLASNRGLGLKISAVLVSQLQGCDARRPIIHISYNEIVLPSSGITISATKTVELSGNSTRGSQPPIPGSRF